MKRTFAYTIALLVGLGLASQGFAQARHDEKPHGMDKTKVEAAASDTAKPAMQSGAGGRHDEKPHGMTKAKSTPKATTKPADGKPAAEAAAAPEAKKAAQ